MSYYNFNDHFWSPKKVCSQSKPSKSKETVSYNKLLLAMLSLAFIALGTPLLFPKIGATQNDTQAEISLKNKLRNKCILIRHKPLQINCSVQ